MLQLSPEVLERQWRALHQPGGPAAEVWQQLPRCLLEWLWWRVKRGQTPAPKYMKSFPQETSRMKYFCFGRVRGAPMVLLGGRLSTQRWLPSIHTWISQGQTQARLEVNFSNKIKHRNSTWQDYFILWAPPCVPIGMEGILWPADFSCRLWPAMIEVREISRLRSCTSIAGHHPKEDK